MRAYLPGYLVIGYTGAAWAAALGVILLRWGQVSTSRPFRIAGVLLLLGSGIGFFAGVPEIWTPGPAGTELSAMAGLAILGAWAVFRAWQMLAPFLPGGKRTRWTGAPPLFPSSREIDSSGAGVILPPPKTRDPGRQAGARWIQWGMGIAAILAIWRWDVPLFFAMNRYAGRTPGIDLLARLLINDYAVPTALAMLAWAMWLTGDPKRQAAVLRAILTVPLSGLIMEAMNALYFRPRPFTDHEVNLLFYHPSDSSFPSNAATVAWAIAVSLGTGDPKVGRVGMLLAAGISWARVYGGVHYPLDVLIGALLGAALSLGVTRGLQEWSIRIARQIGRHLSLPERPGGSP
ncbi:phosphatase PAP2 family protein [Thermoflexus sp.]|uniref:phosphatase PAP2 family protein n=1 Tax=Thermoflexus sp. TaxID=1969742 RepID=UPI0017F6DC26|nr:phosphatase PAP2 family protein [Thermoflexus sp.]